MFLYVEVEDSRGEPSQRALSVTVSPSVTHCPSPCCRSSPSSGVAEAAMWRLAAHVVRGTKVHAVLQDRSVLTTATLLPCRRRGTARGAHSSDMSTAIQKVEAPDAEHLVRVHWEDGSESRYPCVWLRDNCQCPDCFLSSAKARRLLFEDLDVDIVAKEVTLTDRKKVLGEALVALLGKRV